MNHQAIYNTHPNVVSIDDGKGAMDANGNTVTIDQAAYEAEVLRLREEYAATQYQRDRKAEYDQLNQYEMMFDDEVNGTTTWIDAINAIKAKYPKPE